MLQIGVLKGMLKKPTLLAAIVSILGFLVWWNYGSLSMSYPRFRAQLRSWSWRHFGDPFDSEARRIGGSNAIDCSNSLRDEASILSCTSAASKQHKAYRLRYNFRGKDSVGVSGIVANQSGATFELSYNVWNGFVTAWERRCPDPVRISAISDQSGWDIHCLPPAKSENEVVTIRDDWAGFLAERGRK